MGAGATQLAAAALVFIGVCLLAGFATGFRERAYLGWLGLSFLTLAADLFLPRDGFRAAKLALLILTLLLFALAFIAAARETARRLREIRQRQTAFEEQIRAMLEAELKKRESKNVTTSKNLHEISDKEAP